VSWVTGPRAGDNPWRAKTLEWSVSSPPPAHNFDTPPIVTGEPYDFGESALTAPAMSSAAAAD
jgi:cytochrome c oxidase subunit 1